MSDFNKQSGDQQGDKTEEEKKRINLELRGDKTVKEKQEELGILGEGADQIGQTGGQPGRDHKAEQALSDEAKKQR